MADLSVGGIGVPQTPQGTTLSFWGYNYARGQTNAYGLWRNGALNQFVSENINTGTRVLAPLQGAGPTFNDDFATKAYVDAAAGSVNDGSDLSSTVVINPLISFVWKDYLIAGGAGTVSVSSKRQEELDTPFLRVGQQVINWGQRDVRYTGTLAGPVTEGIEPFAGLNEGYVDFPLSAGNTLSLTGRYTYPRGPSNYFWQDDAGASASGFNGLALGYRCRVVSLLGASVDFTHTVTDTSGAGLAPVAQSRVAPDAAPVTIGYTAVALNSGSFTEYGTWQEQLDVTPVGGNAVMRIYARAEFKF